jgi:hypothetical protein
MNKYSLFIKLIKRKCPIDFVNLLENWYNKMYTCVRWGSAVSSFVKLEAGVRQGGILSPLLFAVCIDDISGLLANSSLCCHINVCFNSFLYAVDLLLLSISVLDMQKMIDIVKNELDWIDLSINVKKSVCLRIGKRFKMHTADILIIEKPVAVVQEFKYLGMYIVSAKSFKVNLHETKMKYFRSLNGILGKVGSSCPLNVVLSLVNSFSTPVLLYGLEIACLNKSDIKSLNYPFRSIFHKLFSTFDNEIIEQCQYYTGYLPLQHTLALNCLRFFKSLMHTTVKMKPVGLLYNWFGSTDWDSIASQYNIRIYDCPGSFKYKIWLKFKSDLNL